MSKEYHFRIVRAVNLRALLSNFASAVARIEVRGAGAGSRSTSVFKGMVDPRWNENLPSFRGDSSSLLTLEVECYTPLLQKPSVRSDGFSMTFGDLENEYTQDRDIVFSLTKNGAPAGQIVINFWTTPIIRLGLIPTIQDTWFNPTSAPHFVPQADIPQKLNDRGMSPDTLLHLSWQKAIETGRYQPLPDPPAEIGTWELTGQDTGGLLSNHISAAIVRARESGLCLHRVWAVASTLPGRERNLPALIPPKDAFRIPRHGHRFCTFQVCEFLSINHTRDPQLHLCDNPPCGKLTPPEMFASSAPATQTHSDSRPWSLDGKYRLVGNQAYMAILHVWADGTGVGREAHGRVNACLYNTFCDIAGKLQCEGIWWDTICMPTNQIARVEAMNDIAQHYSNAAYTLVYDRQLSETIWTSPEAACFAFIMSSFFSRGWPALELSKSKKVKVLFKSSSGKDGRYVLKDLDDDILAKRGQYSSQCHWACTSAVLALRDIPPDVNSLLTSLGSRYVSWSRDRAVISASLLGMPPSSGPISQQQIYRQVLLRLGKVYDAHLFHEVSTTGDGMFSWFPHSIFDLPTSTSDGEWLEIKENGDLVGYWDWLCPHRPVKNASDMIELNIIWNDKHPVVELRVKVALQDMDHHAILVERNLRVPIRGLVVKVFKNKNPVLGPPIICQFVGPVHFQRCEAERRPILASIGDTTGFPELKEELASDYILRISKSVEVPPKPPQVVDPGSVPTIDIQPLRALPQPIIDTQPLPQPNMSQSQQLTVPDLPGATGPCYCPCCVYSRT